MSLMSTFIEAAHRKGSVAQLTFIAGGRKRQVSLLCLTDESLKSTLIMTQLFISYQVNPQFVFFYSLTYFITFNIFIYFIVQFFCLYEVLNT